MKLKKIQIAVITVLITTALIGLLYIQLQLLNDSYKQKRIIFNQNVLAALQQTSRMFEINEAADKVFEIAVDSLGLPPLTKSKNPAVKNYTYFYSTGGDKEQLKGGRPVSKVIISGKHDSTTFNAVYVNSRSDSSLPDSRFTFKFHQFEPDSMHKSKGGYFTSVTTGSHPGSLIYIDSLVSKDEISRLASHQLKGLDSAQKNITVKRIVNQLLLMDSLPVEKRITNHDVDSLLKLNFKNSEIYLPYKYAVIEKDPDSLRFILTNADEKQKKNLEQSGYQVSLFPSDTYLPVKNYLSVTFEGTELFLYKQIIWQLVLSLLFIFMIIGGFIYTLRTIFRQKKFGSLIIDFINNMTHEFKTPIATIELASEAINQPEVLQDKEKLTRYNKMIRDENNRMRKQVDRILQMALLEEGDYELNLSELDIHEIINRIVKSFALLIENNGGKIGIALNAVNSKVKVDPVHISNIISNVIDNAVKYSPGKPDIFISTENIKDDISIKISDKGIGIKPEDLKKIFDKYYRVPSGNRHDVKGFGLGLSYVKLMVEAHRGEIRVESTYGEGTIVEIELPAVK